LGNLKQYGIIYKAKNLANGRVYIGQTIKNLNERIIGHKRSSMSEKPRYPFAKAIKKHGINNFEWKIIDVGYDSFDLDKKESFWIEFYNSKISNNGYNVLCGGQGKKKAYNTSDELSIASGGKLFRVYDLNGNLIKSQYSQLEFAKEIGVAKQTINKVLSGNSKTTCGYILIFEDDFSEDELNNIINRVHERLREFMVLDLDDNILGVWNSKRKCWLDLKIANSTIYGLLENPNYGTKVKLKAYYIDNIPNELKEKMEVYYANKEK